MEGGGRELQVYLAFRKAAKWKKTIFLFCFSSSKMQRVDDKQSKCVGVKFLIETVLKLQNIVVNKNYFVKKKIFKRKSLLVIYPNLFCISFREEFFCNVYFNKTFLVSCCVRKAGYLSTVKINSKKVVALWNLRGCLLWEETEVAVPRFCPLLGSRASEEWKGGSQTPVSSCLTSLLCCWVITHCCILLRDTNNPGAQWLMLPSQECKKAGSLQMEMSPLALKGGLW